MLTVFIALKIMIKEAWKFGRTRACENGLPTPADLAVYIIVNIDSENIEKDISVSGSETNFLKDEEVDFYVWKLIYS